MLNHICEPNRRYVTLDDGKARRLAATDPALFFETYGYPLLIDEFQRVPSILFEMKKIVDGKALKGEDNNGMFWLTGSQKFRMMQNVSESLAGRIAVFDMASLSAAEIEERPAALFSPELSVIRERLKGSRKKRPRHLPGHLPGRYAEIAHHRPRPGPVLYGLHQHLY